MAKFWTDKTLLPYQKHNFKVQLILKHISDFDQSKTYVAGGAQIEKTSLQKVSIPPHFIKSIDLPKLSTSVENTAGAFDKDSYIEAAPGDFEDLVVRFHMVKNIPSLIPSIFYAYYLDFSEGKTTSPLPFLQKASKLGAPFNAELVKESSIVVTLLNNDKPIEIKYTNVLPVSYDLGALDYADPDIVEATMTFSYNNKQGGDGGSTNNSSANTSDNSAPSTSANNPSGASGDSF